MKNITGLEEENVLQLIVWAKGKLENERGYPSFCLFVDSSGFVSVSIGNRLEHDDLFRFWVTRDQVHTPSNIEGRVRSFIMLAKERIASQEEEGALNDPDLSAADIYYLMDLHEKGPRAAHKIDMMLGDESAKPLIEMCDKGYITITASMVNEGRKGLTVQLTALGIEKSKLMSSKLLALRNKAIETIDKSKQASERLLAFNEIKENLEDLAKERKEGYFTKGDYGMGVIDGICHSISRIRQIEQKYDGEKATEEIQG